MTEQIKYKYAGKILEKVSDGSMGCEFCFFKNVYTCVTIVRKTIKSSCFFGEDGNEQEMIFMEANEPVNKID